jgi:hypothetical protein
MKLLDLFMFIITGLGFLESGSDRREMKRLRLELEELKRRLPIHIFLYISQYILNEGKSCGIKKN